MQLNLKLLKVKINLRNLTQQTTSLKKLYLQKMQKVRLLDLLLTLVTTTNGQSTLSIQLN